ncbi:tyrosine-protein phosphatase non-receptor type substrate 1-like isoform X2 [Dendropsophus ebraccatus]
MDKQVLIYDNTLNVSRPGLSIDLQAALMGDASLIIPKVKVSDQGVYKCVVIYSPDSKTKEIALEIQAPPIVKVITKPVIKDEENMLHCSITRFYPSDITITWLRGSEVIDTYVTYTPQRQEDGTYSVNSTAVIIPTDDNWKETYTCRVTHHSLPYPLQETFNLKLQDSLQWSYASFISLSTTIPIILMLLLLSVLVLSWICSNTGLRHTEDDGSSPPQDRRSPCARMFRRSTRRKTSQSEEPGPVPSSSTSFLSIPSPSGPVPPIPSPSGPVPPIPSPSGPVPSPLIPLIILSRPLIDSLLQEEVPLVRDMKEQVVVQTGCHPLKTNTNPPVSLFLPPDATGLMGIMRRLATSVRSLFNPDLQAREEIQPRPPLARSDSELYSGGTGARSPANEENVFLQYMR